MKLRNVHRCDKGLWYCSLSSNSSVKVMTVEIYKANVTAVAIDYGYRRTL